MPLADLADFRAALTEAQGIVSINQIFLQSVTARIFDNWMSQVPAPVTPTTAVAPTRTTAGALGQENGGAGTLAIVGARYNGMNAGVALICDRLSHQGGLVANLATAQTTNLPTAALTRETTGEGVMLGLTLFTQLGVTGTTVTASYTNQAGTAGKITEPVVLGNTGFREAGRLILLPLAAGDTGVRAVASVTVLATTGTAGSFGVTLFKPLYAIVMESTSGVAAGGFVSGGMSGGIPEVVDDACLFVVTNLISNNLQAAGALLLTEH